MDDFAAIQTSVQENLVATTRGVARLAAEDLPFHRSLEPRLGSQLDKQNARLLGLAQRLLGSAATDTKAVRPSLKDIDDVEGNWTKVVDIVDSLLERADTALDEFTGAVKRLLPQARETVSGTTVVRRIADNLQTARTNGLTTANKLGAAFKTQEIDKPQLRFDLKVDNYPKGPFKPLLTTKPHATKPLQIEPSILDEDEPAAFDHPYRHEIEQYIYPGWMHYRVQPMMYHDFEKTEATFVNTEEALDEMLEELKKVNLIAVDLEHHDSRTYIGIVSLMQISTRDKDWIVDTLVPWRHKLSRLNEVFADPAIVKVLHGAHMDIIWMQRDLGIYVVGLFDTFAAASSLGYPQRSYAALLKKWTGVDAQKQYQMADWRIRPLPQELIDYARSDTHYLLYVFDNMRNELIERSKEDPYSHERERVLDVLRRSKETALQRYEHPVYDYEEGQGPVGWYRFLARTPAMLSKQQFAVFKAVHKWRDDLAREQDDGTYHVLPHHFILAIAKAMPTTKEELLAIAEPASQSFTTHGNELVAKIVEAKAKGEEGPEMMEILQKYEVKRERPRTLDGVAGYLPKPVPKAPSISNGLASLLPLRSIKSLFWGSAINAADQQKRAYTISAPIVQMSVPMPVVGANVFAENAPPQLPTPVDSPLPAQVTEQSEDDVFILREMKKKRKLAPTTDDDDGMKHQLDEVTLSNEDEDRLRDKAERKRARKEAKRAVKAGVTEADEPFDYASAPSMLNPAPVGKKDKKRVKKSFNPWSKASDAPRGLPRSQKEGAGRSMTFKS